MSGLKYILATALIVIALISVTNYKSLTFGQLRTFVSEQVGSGPADGEILQTNGSTSTWVATSTLGFDNAYIRKDGTSVTTASIPFAQGLTTSDIVMSGALWSLGDNKITLDDGLGNMLFTLTSGLDFDFSAAGRIKVGTDGFTSSGQIASTLAIGTSPFAITSTTVNTNLNADMVDGKHTGTSGNVVPLLDGANTWSGKQTFGTIETNHPAISAPGSPTEGDLWNDSTQKSLFGFLDGVKQSLPGVIFTQTDSVTVTSSGLSIITGTLLGTGVGTTTLPANFFTIGKTVRVTLYGVFTTPALPPTATFKAYLNSTTIATGASAVTPNKNLTNQGWKAEFVITGRTTGATGTVFSQGVVSLALTTVDGQSIFMPSSATVTIDTTVAQTIDFNLGWAQGAGASMTSTNAMVEVLN